MTDGKIIPQQNAEQPKRLRLNAMIAEAESRAGPPPGYTPRPGGSTGHKPREREHGLTIDEDER